MRNLARAVPAIIALTAFMAASALGAVSITWTDTTTHTVQLQNVWNDDYTGDPVSAEKQYIWAGTLDVTFTTPDPIEFRVSGDFMGVWGEAWPQVRITQNILNSTPYTWTDFHADIVDEIGGEFHKLAELQPGWSGSKDIYSLDMVASEPQYYVQPGSYLGHCIVFWAEVDDDNPEGAFTFSEYPTYAVPEAGSLAGLLTGLVGFTTLIRRRTR